MSISLFSNHYLIPCSQSLRDPEVSGVENWAILLLSAVGTTYFLLCKEKYHPYGILKRATFFIATNIPSLRDSRTLACYYSTIIIKN